MTLTSEVMTADDAHLLDDDELRATITEAARVWETVQANLRVLVTEDAERHLHDKTGHVNAAQALTATTGIPDKEAKRLAHEGRTLSKHRFLAEHVEAGGLPTDRLQLLLSVAGGRTADRFLSDGPALTDAVIAAATYRDAKSLVTRWHERVTADGTEPKDKDDTVQIARLFDTLLGQFRLSGVDREAFEAELERLVDIVTAEDKTAGRERTPSQRRAAALGLMAVRSASLGDRPLTRPLVVMVMTHAEYLRHEGAVLLNSGAGVAHDTVEHATCTGLLCRLVMDATGRIIDMGRDARCNTEDQRLARIIRDRTCVFADCDVPAADCQGHHADAPWTKGGLTDLDQIGSLCDGHHDLVHHRGWTLTHNRDGSWTATNRDGLQLHRPPPPDKPPTLDLDDP